MLEGEAIASEIRELPRQPVAALLQHVLARIRASETRYDWVGVYLLKGDTLVLAAYQGRPTEHTQIPVGVGVCGTAVAERRDINVPDVRAVSNYLACSTETRSELVVLIRDGPRILGQIDIDSDRPAAFDARDERELAAIAAALAERLSP